MSGDISEAPGYYMAANLPSVFADFAERAFRAIEQPDGMQVPTDWGKLIEGLPIMSDDYFYHLFSLRGRCLNMILSSVSRVWLCLLTTCPTTLSPTINKVRKNRKAEVWNPHDQDIQSLLSRKGRAFIFHNEKTFPVQLLRLALFTMAKCSQRK